MEKLSIIIVNYNTEEYIRNCLKSIIEFCGNLNYEIIIVDNNSPDRSIVNLSKEYPAVRFIYLKKNIGFGAGCNVGVENSNSDFILFLNPDIILKENSVQRLINYIKSDCNVGVCSGILLDECEKIAYSFNNFPDLRWEFKEAYGLFLKSTIKRMLSRQEIINKIPFEVDWFHGACMLIRREIFNEVKGFDENIFLYYEDVDLQKKIKTKGYKIVCVPSAEFIHYTKSSVRAKDFDIIYHFYMHTSKIYYYKKYNMNFKVMFIRVMYISGSIIKILSIPFRPKIWNEISKRIRQYKIIIGIYSNIIKKI